ncbi:uncharacterized protein METZ01_LOCUS372525, partial [marine metagenome]
RLHLHAGGRRGQGRLCLRKKRRPWNRSGRGWCSRPRPACHDTAPHGTRPHQTYLSLRRPGLSLDRRTRESPWRHLRL